jgi:hypothetical protein
VGYAGFAGRSRHGLHGGVVCVSTAAAGWLFHPCGDHCSICTAGIIIAAPLCFDAGVDGIGDRGVGSACLVLIDDRRILAVMFHLGRQERACTGLCVGTPAQHAL